jgi:hypothetical protein
MRTQFSRPIDADTADPPLTQFLDGPPGAADGDTAEVRVGRLATSMYPHVADDPSAAWLADEALITSDIVEDRVAAIPEDVPAPAVRRQVTQVPAYRRIARRAAKRVARHRKALTH